MTITFSHQDKILTINQLDYCTPDLHPNANTTVPLINDSTSTAQYIGACLFKDPSLMGIFPLSAPDLPIVAHVNMISFGGSYDPRRVPSPLASSLLVPQDPIPLPSSSLGEPPATCNHKI